MGLGQRWDSDWESPDLQGILLTATPPYFSMYIYCTFIPLALYTGDYLYIFASHCLYLLHQITWAPLCSGKWGSFRIYHQKQGKIKLFLTALSLMNCGDAVFNGAPGWLNTVIMTWHCEIASVHAKVSWQSYSSMIQHFSCKLGLSNPPGIWGCLMTHSPFGGVLFMNECSCFHF